MPTLPAQQLQIFATAILQAAGVTPDEARTVAASLVESNLRGHDSHGVFRVLEYTQQLQRGDLASDAPFTVLHESPALLHADGELGFGQIQCARLIEQVCDKARTSGIACGTLRRSGHVGRLGEWVELAARQGFAAFLAVNDNGFLMYVAPPGGTAPRISTNPLAIGIPTATEPLVLDMSTSAVARGKVRVAQLAGKECPPGWIQDSHGNPTTDPWAISTNPPGSLLPLGGDQGYKGFALGMLLDILTAGLSGGTCPPAPDQTETNNVLLVVWNPDRFAGHDHFRQETEKLIAWVRATPTREGVDRILLPGDLSQETRQKRLRDGIPLPGDNWTKLVELAQQSGVVPPTVEQP
ncbi:MAG: Ldh family oxidoreductase [Planctomycetales bacterium]